MITNSVLVFGYRPRNWISQNGRYAHFANVRVIAERRNTLGRDRTRQVVGRSIHAPSRFRFSGKQGVVFGAVADNRFAQPVDTGPRPIACVEIGEVGRLFDRRDRNFRVSPQHPSKTARPALRGAHKKQVVRFSAHTPALAFERMVKAQRAALQLSARVQTAFQQKSAHHSNHINKVQTTVLTPNRCQND